MTTLPQKAILGMDHNTNLLLGQSNNRVMELLSAFVCEGFSPHITKATRITDTSSTLIDGIFSRGLRIVANKILTCDISDHFGCLVACDFEHPAARNPIHHNNSCKNQYSKLTGFDYARINIALDACDWSNLETLNVDQSIILLTSKIKDELDMCINQKTRIGAAPRQKRKRKYKQPWMSNGILQSAKRLHAMYKLTIGLSKFDPVVILYKNQRHIFNKLKRHAKKSFFENKVINSQSDPKKLWRVLLGAVGKNTQGRGDITSIIVNGQCVDTPSGIADGFCEYFSNIGQQLASKIKQENVNPISFFIKCML